MKLLTLILSLLFSTSVAHAGALATLANSMTPGTYATLTTTGDAVLRVGGSTGTMMPFSMSAVWDPVSGTVQYVGNDHNAPSLRHVIYTEATNTWSLAFADPGLGVAHGYEHLAINTFTNQIYHRQYGIADDIQISRYSGGASGTWSPYLWTGINCGYEQVAMAIGFWSGTMTGITAGVGTLVIYDSGETNGRVCMINPANGTVQFSTSGFGGTSTYHSFFEYSPIKNVAVFGGGNDNARKIWRLNADRTVTALLDAPVDLGIQRGFVTVDPVTGNFLVLSGGVLRQLDPAGSGTWAIIATPPGTVGNPGQPALANMFTVPISTYGVVMYVTCTPSSCNVVLYKHSAVAPDTTPPTAPTSLIATTLSAAQINLSWTDATDNIGVAGYRVERCTPAACSNFVQVYTPLANSQVDLGLAAGTLYRYRVRAIDAAGNLGPYSNIAEATTSPPLAGDFAARCAAAGVIRCNGFDTDADRGTVGATAFGANFGVFSNNVSNCPTTGPSQCPTIDTVTKASGAGSLKFVVPTQSGSGGSGQFFSNFSSNLQTRFGSGQTFYIQWRQRFTSCFLFQGASEPCTGPRRSFSGAGGWKTADISTGDRAGVCLSNGTNCATSCTALEIVMQNTNHRGFLQGYHGCPGTYLGSSLPFEEAFPVNDFKLQNAYSGFCPYQQVSVGNITNCLPFFGSEWLTYKVRVTMGTFTVGGVCGGLTECYPNSTVEYWQGRDGQATVKTHSFTFNLNAEPGEVDKYGKIWLLPYNTSKSSAEVHTEMYVWYDELIISTQDIADPSAAIPPGPAVLKGITASGKIVTSGKVKSQ